MSLPSLALELEEARALYQKGDLGGAIRKLEEKANAGKAEASDYAYLGTLLSLRGENEKALTCYKEAARLEPTTTSYLHNVAVTYHYMGQLEEAREWFGKILKINPQEPRAQEYLNSMEEARQKHEAQMKQLESQLEPEEKTFEEYLRVGRIYQRLQKWELAEKYFKEADALEGHSYEVKAMLARLAYRRRDFTGALERWEQAMQIAPNSLEALCETGRLYAFCGRLREAARTWTRVAQLTRPDQPEYQEAQYYLQNLKSFL